MAKCLKISLLPQTNSKRDFAWLQIYSSLLLSCADCLHQFSCNRLKRTQRDANSCLCNKKQRRRYSGAFSVLNKNPSAHKDATHASTCVWGKTKKKIALPCGCKENAVLEITWRGWGEGAGEEVGAGTVLEYENKKNKNQISAFKEERKL